MNNKHKLATILTLPFTVLQVLIGLISTGIVLCIDRTIWNNHVIEEKMKADMYEFWNWVLDEADEDTKSWLDEKSEEWRKLDGF